MLVYRVVDEDGKSPYYYGLCKSIGMPVSYSNQHPDPSDDVLGGWVQPWEYCGFHSLQQLHWWFGDWFEELDAAGAVVRVFEVDEQYVRKGLRQVVFCLEEAVLVEEMTFEKAFDKMLEG